MLGSTYYNKEIVAVWTAAAMLRVDTFQLDDLHGVPDI